MGFRRSMPTGYLLHRIAQVTNARFGERIEILGIRPKHFGLLLAIESSAASTPELGRLLGTDSGSVTAMLDDLETRGAVIRVADPRTHHRIVIELTNAGRQMLETARRFADEVDAEVLADLDDPRREALDAALQQVADSPSAQNRLDPLD